MDRQYNTVLLAALLHDIGKFIQRADFPGSIKITGKHPEVSAKFLQVRENYFSNVAEPAVLVELVRRHHEAGYFPPELRVQYAPEAIKPLAYLVSTADNYSSSERGEWSNERHDYKTVPLASVFARLKLQKPLPEINHYKLHQLNPANSFPKHFSQLLPVKTGEYVKSFGSEFDFIIKSVDSTRFDVLFSHLLSLLQRYTWCVPASTQEDNPDISLYDHLKTTASITACLYRYHQHEGSFSIEAITDRKNDKFILIAGDLSGIQNYIFGISSIGTGGVAKRLRARSFYLTALVESISYEILRRFELPLTNIIMASGGKFYILAPVTAGIEDNLNVLRQELDFWFVKNFHGELAMNLAWMPFNGAMFNSFGDVIAGVNEELKDKKAAPLRDYLVRGGKWQSENFLIKKDAYEEGACRSCRKHPATDLDEENHRVCSFCLQDRRLGSKLVDADYIAYTDGSAGRYDNITFPLYGNFRVAVLKNPPGPDFPAYIVQKLNETGLEELIKHPSQFKFLANYIPRAGEDLCACPGCELAERPGKGEPLYFDCLANRAKGRKLLGYLKADVDYLGSLFVYGLRKDIRDDNSISRIATLSRMLDLFFSGRVEQLLNIDFENCYTVFSGGDDLLIIGPWDEIVRLAFTVQKEFRLFTSENPNVNLSAGIGLAKPKTPLSRAVQAAEEALEKAKEGKSAGEPEGRDQLSFLDSTMKWGRAENILASAENLSNWLKNELLSVAFVRKFLVYADMYKEYREKGDIRGLRYLPLLTYNVRRNFKDLTEETGEPEKSMRLWLESLKQKDGENITYLDFLATYALILKE